MEPNLEAIDGVSVLRVVTVGQDKSRLKTCMQLVRKIYADDPAFVSPLELAWHSRLLAARGGV